MINPRVGFSDANFIGEDCCIDPRAEWGTMPGFKVIKGGVRHNCRADPAHTKFFQSLQDPALDVDQSELKSAPPAFNRGNDAFFIYSRIDCMRDEPHGF